MDGALFASPIDARDPAAVACCPDIVEAVRRGLGLHNAQAGGSSSRIARVVLLTEAPSLDAGEITDKGYINQRAVLERRDDDVKRLYAAGPARPASSRSLRTAPLTA
jgi:feruloyl-CoA synthase